MDGYISDKVIRSASLKLWNHTRYQVAHRDMPWIFYIAKNDSVKTFSRSIYYIFVPCTDIGGIVHWFRIGKTQSKPISFEIIDKSRTEIGLKNFRICKLC